MPRILVIDFETTGPDRACDRPWEVAAVLLEPWSQRIRVFNERMWGDDYPEISEGARRACKIPDSRIKGAPQPAFVLLKLQELMQSLGDADYALAYNAKFDREVYERECERQGIVPFKPNWLCGLMDVPYPDYFRCRQLSHLALDHGIRVNPDSTHGAIGDCNLFIELMQKGGYSLDAILEYKNDPWVFIKAELPKPWGPRAEQAKLLQGWAKEDGYGWETCKGTEEPIFKKTWVKRVKQAKLEAEKAKQLPFKRSLLNEKDH